jgi:serpin B
MPYDHVVRRASVTALLAGILLASACTRSTPIGTAVAQALQNDTPVPPQIVAADNSFGLTLFHALNQGATSNVVISPTSIALALDMIYNGAEGSTRQGISRALQLQGLGALVVDRDNAALQAALIHPDPQVQLTTVNSLWMHLSKHRVLSSFVSTNAAYYAATIGDLGGTPDYVNAWIASKTNGLIKAILPAGDYSSVVAVLANAIYFRGPWTSPFNPDLTSAAPFTLNDGTRVSCQMMKMTRADRFPYLSGPDFQAVELLYGRTGRLRMLIILPAAGVNLGSFVADMTNEELSSWIADLEPAEVSVRLPRFATSYASSLVDALTSLGMGPAFDRKIANFAGLDSHGGVYISDVEHEAVVQTDERGTVAAAATAAIAYAQSLGPPPIRMTMDRPFFYAIVDAKTGALLFIGTLVDPSRGSSNRQ